jgi:hypothetical protein
MKSCSLEIVKSALCCDQMLRLNAYRNIFSSNASDCFVMSPQLTMNKWILIQQDRAT